MSGKKISYDQLGPEGSSSGQVLTSNGSAVVWGEGGGGGSSARAGGSGGSGIVIIRYKSPTQRATGGSVTSYTSGSDTFWVHTFTSSGTFAT